MKIYIGVTDDKWFDFLAQRQPDEVNFWRPGGARDFRVLQPGEPFLFKLHSPNNYIAGGAFFVRHTNLPVSLAWAAFGDKNGAVTLDVLHSMISRHRHDDQVDPVIGCSILAQPFFLPRDQWIPVPDDWKSNVVQGKGYSTDEASGARLWSMVQERLPAIDLAVLPEPDGIGQRYGKEFLARARLGQGTFRILVTDAYHRCCAITGERTLPVLEASHIMPFAQQGPNRISNGLLLRSDLHTLYDQGYLTVTKDFRIEVSLRIKKEFQNGRHYYDLAGRELANVPDDPGERPSQSFLEWHNQHVYVA